MEYTPFSLLIDVGWISVLMVIGNALRRTIPWFQKLLLPSPIIGGLLGMILGPEMLGWIGFSDKMGSYTTILIAAVFASMPFSMVFDRSVRSGAKTMWSYTTGMFLLQWGLFILLGFILFKPIWGTEDWFGMMLPTGFVGGFGTAAAVGSSLDAAGADGVASSLGFTSATVGTIAAIVGGVIFANWGIRTGRASTVPQQLPKEMRTGYIDDFEARPSIGKATTNPSSIEAVTLHVGVIALCIMIAYYANQAISHFFPEVSVPLFAMSFVVAIAVKLLLNAVGGRDLVDRDTVSSISGGATDYLIAFGIASIIPAAIADYLVPLIVLFVLGTVWCTAWFFIASPIYFGKNWLERGIFSWGWNTAAVATGIALLKIVDPKMKSGTLNEYGVAYVGFAPFEIGMTIVAPIAVLAGWTMGLGVASVVIAILAMVAPFVFRWMPKDRQDTARRKITG
ncbi:sodium:glutamate symporter [Corynebacterium atypicum]|uniref:Sodium:glutamate symporter n=1 Tax=Corynebacterium atypicum TaxID=191610 RepID=A0ABN4DE41_9CORY|nr:sodium/glutamate symporter [Corynebacterium atypicum]AIG64734.1 sodium:glutamate symporter [Corynebacterium atypicum]